MHTIFLEGSKFSKDIASGITNYIMNLFEAFKSSEAELGIQSKIILVNKFPEQNIFYQKSRVAKSEFIIYKRLTFLFNMVFGLRAECDLFHSPYMFLPPKTKNRINVLTVHDLINLEKSFSPRNFLRSLLLRVGVARAHHYICVSHSTKEKLKYHFKTINDDRISVIYQGIDNTFFSEPPALPHPPPSSLPYLL
jgi:hypothetical protein